MSRPSMVTMVSFDFEIDLKYGYRPVFFDLACLREVAALIKESYLLQCICIHGSSPKGIRQ